jgi:hypothetical protein
VPIADQQSWGEIEGLTPTDGRPCWDADEIVIMSMLVLQRHRQISGWGSNYVAPGTGPNDGAVRNSAGQIEAVTRLVRG